MINDVTQAILAVVNITDYQKGLQYDEDKITPLCPKTINDSIRYQFLVTSEHTTRKYMTQIIMRYHKVDRIYCSCSQFKEINSCKHVAACLISYSNELFRFEDNKVKEKASMQILSIMKEQFNKPSRIKKEVFLIPYFVITNYYYRTSVELKIKIGINKTYSLLGKLSSFMNAYNNHEKYQFGALFTYDPDENYFSEKSIKLLDFLENLKENYQINSTGVPLYSRDIKRLFQIVKDGIYDNQTGKLVPLIEGYPVSIKLSKTENHQYLLTYTDSLNDLKNLTEDYEYIYYHQIFYHLNREQQLLLSSCMEKELNQLVFKENDFNDLQEAILKVVKNQLILDDTTKDIIIASTPDVKLYFDLNGDSITCNPCFLYQDKEISYFDKVNGIIRDSKIEDEVSDTLLQNHFSKMSQFFLLDDFDLVGEFMDIKLDELAKKYPVFTSERMKETHIKKTGTVSATFHIGKDRILHYDFDLGDIKEEELDNLLEQLKKKKKYYRLKNGDIINIEDDSLKELENLTEEFDLDNHKHTLPKYQALYLDSLKESKYHIIKTDSMFQEFISQFKSYKESKITFTKEELSILRDYQKEGIKWLYTIYKCGFGGILADEMGLGKSIQTIYFLRRVLKEKSDSQFLIVCPTSLVYNWKNEMDKFATELAYEVFAGLRNERQEKLKDFTGTIYITSYGLLREDMDFYQEKKFEVVIIDEAQNIKNPKTGLTKAVKNIKANTKIALTGTPIENSIIELWSIFDYMMPGFLSNLMKFSEKYKVKDFDEDTNQLLNELKNHVKPFILRRKKSEVVKDLPAKIENNIYIDLNEGQKEIYAAEVNHANKEMDQLITSGGFKKNKMIILSLLTKLRQICIDPSIILKDYHGGSAKIDNLLDIIKQQVSNGHKILLFTSFKTALMLVKERLDEESISNYVIAGDVSAKKRQMLVDAFNKDNTNVFLIMLKSGGTGINLTSADVVIHLDLWWNPQAENQATDRTHRIGQTKSVEVIKLISKGTIEEKILDLQLKKKILSDKILEENMDDASYLKGLTEEDVRNLLAYENQE